ncbi:MAG: PaaI family thioesterase [Aquisalinus sp.]|nr:PaaI family thioesterase [Aquisalinus sp.]
MIPDLSQNVLEKLERRIAISEMAGWLNLAVTIESGQLIYTLGFDEAHIGNPVIRAIHGGVVSTFLETASWYETYARLPEDVGINVTSVHTNFLRSTTPTDVHASVSIHRLGRRFGFLEATCWQEDRNNPVATAETGIRIKRPDEKSSLAIKT